MHASDIEAIFIGYKNARLTKQKSNFGYQIMCNMTGSNTSYDLSFKTV